MKITVLGAGAMGSLFGGLLKESGADVVLLDLWEEHVRTIRQQGLILLDEQQERNIQVQARTSPRGMPPADLLLVFVKSTQTAQAAQTAKKILHPEGLILTLQNGMGNGEALAAVVDPRSILVGTTSHGAHVLGPGRVRHAGRGETIIGPWRMSQAGLCKAAEVSKTLNAAGIRTRTSEHVLENLWDKLLINVGINAITALTGITNGRIVEIEAAKQLAKTAVDEAAAVAASLGIRVRPDPAEHVFKIARSTQNNRSSMGQDVDRRRKTEIEAINGYVLAEAAKTGDPAPVNEALTALIQTLETGWQGSSRCED